MELQQLTDRASQGLLLLLPVRLLPDVEAATAAEREVSVAGKSCLLAQLTCQGS